MATQRTVYEGAALGTRTFPSTKHIASKRHMACFLFEISTSSWQVVLTNTYELIKNALVLEEVVDTAKYSKLELRSADNEDELLAAAGSIDAIAAVIAEIEALGRIVPELKIVAQHAPDLETHMNKIDNDITSFAHNLGSAVAQVKAASASAQLTAQIAVDIDQDLKDAIALRDSFVSMHHEIDVWYVSTHKDAVDVATAKSDVEGIQRQVVIELGHASDSEVEAGHHATEAQHWAIMPHNVQVPEGGSSARSALHWAVEAKSAATPATNAQIEAGLDNHAEITSLGLKHGFTHLLGQSSHTSGASVIVRTRPDGTIDPTLIPHTRDTFLGIFKPTAATEYPPTAALHNGNYFVIEGLGLGVDYEYTAGNLNGKRVADRDELVWDGTIFHLIGKPDMSTTDLVHWSAKASASQAANANLDDVFVTPKTMHAASDAIMAAFMGAKASTIGEVNKLVMMPSTGILPAGILPLGLGHIETLAKTALTVDMIRAWKPYGVYCSPDVVAGSNVHSDTQLLLGITNAYSEMMFVPTRDPNVVKAYGLDNAGHPVEWVLVIPKTTAGTKVMAALDAPKFYKSTLTKVV